VELSDAESDIDMTRTAVEDDFAGRIYDSAVDGSDAVYVHAGGAYTTEVRDAADEIGAYRINPTRRPRKRTNRSESTGPKLARPRSPGSSPTIAEETRAEVAAVAAKAATTTIATIATAMAAARMASAADRRTR